MLRNILLLTITTVITLSLFEALDRLFFLAPMSVSLTGKPALNTSLVVEHSDQEIKGLYIQTADGFRLRPNAEATVKNHPLGRKNSVVKTNELGMRAKSLAELHSGYRRILLLGDSITLQEYLPAEETIANQLELSLRTAGIEVEILNGGVNGFGLTDYVKRLAELQPALHPDYIIVNLYLNDLLTSPTISLPQLPWPVSKLRLAQRTATGLTLLKTQLTNQIPQIYHDWANEAHRVAERLQQSVPTFAAKLMEAETDWGLAWSPSAWEEIERQLGALEELARRNNSRVIIALYPVLPQITITPSDSYPQQRFAEITDKKRLKSIDLLPQLKEAYATGKESFFYDHCHPNEAGSRVIANALANYLIEEFKSVHD